MSKTFADEYKKLAEADLPDLWERIEAGIALKAPAATSAEAEKETETETETEKEAGIRIATGKDFAVESPKTAKLEPLSYRNRPGFLRRYGGLLAACLCAAVIIPAVYLNGGFGGNHESSTAYDMAAVHESAAGSADAPVPETDTALTAPAEAPAAQDLAPAAELPAEAQNSGAALPEEELLAKEAARTSESEYGADMMAGNVTGEIIAEQNSAAEVFFDITKARASFFRVATDEKIIEIPGVTIEVTAFDTGELVYTYAPVAADYKATVINDESGILHPDISIYFKKHEALEYDIAVGETYQVDLVFWEANGPYYFTVVNVW